MRLEGFQQRNTEEQNEDHAVTAESGHCVIPQFLLTFHLPLEDTRSNPFPWLSNVPSIVFASLNVPRKVVVSWQPQSGSL